MIDKTAFPPSSWENLCDLADFIIENAEGNLAALAGWDQSRIRKFVDRVSKIRAAAVTSTCSESTPGEKIDALKHLLGREMPAVRLEIENMRRAAFALKPKFGKAGKSELGDN